ncbi:MAG: hypothetical protein ACLQVN_22165 [Bryobacteraceae bacterium]
MNRCILILCSATMACAYAQPALPVKSAAAPLGRSPSFNSAKAAPIALATFSTLESGFDGKLTGYNINDPIDLLGRTRGLYLDGYGAVFTTEISLIVTPSINPFHPSMSPAEIAGVHKRKLDRLPVVRQLLKDMTQTAARTLTQIPGDQQVVVAFRLLYLPWEDTSALPGLLIAKADRRSALAGDIKIEEQR